jgi:FtsP/CotA-like multicopper oxidase with cupredoxin domain
MKLSRRDLLRIGLFSSASLSFLPFRSPAWSHPASTCPLLKRDEEIAKRILGDWGSPCTRPFVTPLPIPPVKRPVRLNPLPQEQTLPGEGRTLSHQQFGTLYGDLKNVAMYEVHQQEFLHSFHPDLPLQPAWGFDGWSPGPTYHMRYGQPAIIRNWNQLPITGSKEQKPLKKAKGDEFGLPCVSTHLHNGHTTPESDGNPMHYWKSGQFYDQCYANRYAGFELDPRVRDGFSSPGDPAEALGTLWYHDHMHDATAANVYKGLVGTCLLFDELDSGDEQDPSPLALRLPSGQYDVPIVFADKVFDPADGLLYFDHTNHDGIVGDKVLVNGVIQPYFQVARRKYRFRFINAGPARFYQLYLSHGMMFTQISNDGNLLDHPVVRQTPSRLGVAERIDVIIDFSQAKIGDQICLENRLRQTDGKKAGDVQEEGVPLMRFDVVRDAPDPSRVPDQLRPRPNRVDPLTCAGERVFNFDKSQSSWTVNGKPFVAGDVVAHPAKNSSEIWRFKNGGGGWDHPIHVHHNEFMLLSRNGLPVSEIESGRKDVVRLDPGGEVTLLMRFRDFVGQYPIHCHNVLHEDHAMMVMFEIKEKSQGGVCPAQDMPVRDKVDLPECDRHPPSHDHERRTL